MYDCSDRAVLSGSENGTVYVWDLVEGNLVRDKSRKNISPCLTLRKPFINKNRLCSKTCGIDKIFKFK